MTSQWLQWLYGMTIHGSVIPVLIQGRQLGFEVTCNVTGTEDVHISSHCEHWKHCDDLQMRVLISCVDVYKNLQWQKLTKNTFTTGHLKEWKSSIVKPLLNILYSGPLIKWEKNLLSGWNLHCAQYFIALRNADTSTLCITELKSPPDGMQTILNTLCCTDAHLPLPQDCCWIKQLDCMLVFFCQPYSPACA